MQLVQLVRNIVLDKKIRGFCGLAKANEFVHVFDGNYSVLFVTQEELVQVEGLARLVSTLQVQYCKNVFASERRANPCMLPMDANPSCFVLYAGQSGPSGNTGATGRYSQ